MDFFVPSKAVSQAGSESDGELRDRDVITSRTGGFVDIEKWLSTLNILTYGIRQARYSTAHVDTIFNSIIDGGAFAITASAYLDQVRAALAYHGDLGALVGLEDRDDDVRGFLRAVESRLASRLGV